MDVNNTAIDYNSNWNTSINYLETTDVPTNDSDTDKRTLLENEISKALQKYYSIFLLAFGTVGNILCFAVLSRKSFRSATVGIYLRLLTLSDLGALYTGVFYFTALAIFDINVRKTDELSCKLHRWLSFFFCDLSSWVLVLVTTSRLISIAWPMKRLITRKRVYISIVITIIFLLGANLPIFIMYGDVEITAKNTTRECVLINESYDEFYNYVFGWIVLLKFAMLPAAILIGLNTALVINVSRSGKALNKIQKTTSSVVSTHRLVSRWRSKTLHKSSGKDEEEEHDCMESNRSRCRSSDSRGVSCSESYESNENESINNYSHRNRRGVLDRLLTYFKCRDKPHENRFSIASGNSDDDHTHWLCDMRMLVSRENVQSRHDNRDHAKLDSSEHDGKTSQNWNKYYDCTGVINNFQMTNTHSSHGSGDAGYSDKHDHGTGKTSHRNLYQEKERPEEASKISSLGNTDNETSTKSLFQNKIKSERSHHQTTGRENLAFETDMDTSTAIPRNNSRNNLGSVPTSTSSSVFTISSIPQICFTYNPIKSNPLRVPKQNNDAQSCDKSVVLGRCMRGAITVGSTPAIFLQGAEISADTEVSSYVSVQHRSIATSAEVAESSTEAFESENDGAEVAESGTGSASTGAPSDKCCNRCEISSTGKDSTLIQDNDIENCGGESNKDTRDIENVNVDSCTENKEKSDIEMKSGNLGCISAKCNENDSSTERCRGTGSENRNSTDRKVTIEDTGAEETISSSKTLQNENTGSTSCKKHSNSSSSPDNNRPNHKSTHETKDSAEIHEDKHQTSPKSASTPHRQMLSQSRRRRSSSGPQNSRGKNKSLTRTLLVINTVFIICNVPITVYLAGKKYIWPDGYDAFQDLYVTISNFTMYTNNSINFILYCVTGTRFRRELLAMFKDLFITIASFLRRVGRAIISL